MSLLSVKFLIFWLITTVVYFLVPKAKRWAVLLTASFVFYFAGGIGTGVFMLFTVASVYGVARWLDQKNGIQKTYLDAHKDLSKEEKKAYRSKMQRTKRLILAAGLVLNFGFLVYLKYFNFLSYGVFRVLNVFGVKGSAPTIDLALPLGISFYTLQAAGYLIDVYRGRISAEKNPFRFALFVSFFPQIIQGPIARYEDLACQLYEGHDFDEGRLHSSLQLILWGLFKKLVIAGNIGIIADQIFNNPQKYEGIIIALGTVCYGLQVYADFSGGMDMIGGIANIFGIQMTVNFERPYFAQSLEEFWRRWHITLGAWMRNYVFYPLSLSRAFAEMGKRTRKIFGTHIGKKLPTFLASFISFLLVGIWHGSSFRYVVYGLWNSVIITSSILLEPVYVKLEQKLHIDAGSAGWKIFRILRTFVIVSIGRLFSRAASLRTALSMLKRMIRFNPWVLTDGSLLKLGASGMRLNLIVVSLAVLFAVSYKQEKGVRIREKLNGQSLAFQWVITMIGIAAIIVFGVYGEQYNAANFIYQNF